MALLLAFLAWVAAAHGSEDAATEAGRDISALVQGSVRTHRADTSGPEELLAEDYIVEEAAQEGLTLGDSVQPHELGPMVYSRHGRIVGEEHETYNAFMGVPFAEKPERFEAAEPKKPWAPKIYNAMRFREACVGAGLFEPESEDCLHLNVWVPKGGHKGMPVIVYFHGGINQRGSGSELIRRGDGITSSAKYPTIFINFNFRLGIFGWMSLQGSNITDNLGLLDQQAALRWVHENIAAFGGDPSKVTLQGHSEGCGIILVHMVAPGSRGLFHRCAFHSPPADLWSRSSNIDRTNFMVARAKCKRPSVWSTVLCLKQMDAARLWSTDWVAEELSRNAGGRQWAQNVNSLFRFLLQSKRKGEIPGQLGWHAVVDNVTLLGEPRDLIRQGRFQRVPVLITTTRNESRGVIPHALDVFTTVGLDYLNGAAKEVESLYSKTLAVQGIHVESRSDLRSQIPTDKVWTCDIRSLAADLSTGGGRAYIGMFAHAPKYAPVGKLTSPLCDKGATCHSDDMMYLLPQGPRGIQGPGMDGELAFSRKYMDSFLAFVHGIDTDHPWVPWDAETQIVTFYKASGAYQVPRYRKEQCDVLNRFMGRNLPPTMLMYKRRG